MRNKLIAVLLVTGFCAVGIVPAQKPAGEVQKSLVDRVRVAIDRGVKFLRDNQRADGGWLDEAFPGRIRGGGTALALLALLNAGIKPDDPVIQNGLKRLREERVHEKSMVYVVGLMTMVYVEANQNQDLLRIQECVKWLVNARVEVNGQLRGWGYSTGGGQMPDHSNSQYALLGLWAGKTAGAKIEPAVWESIRAFYLRTQLEDHGWPYGRGRELSTLTMTTAGLCGLLIAGMELNEGREIWQPEGWAKNCGVYKENKNVQQALGWVGRHLTFTPAEGAVFYNAYGIERAGRLTGLRFIGNYDWYREGCAQLVGMQRDNGSWSSNTSFDGWPLISTSFALLFLSKGRTPILISKLAHGEPTIRYGPNADWNNDRYDARNLVEFCSRELFKRQPLAWQIFDAGRVPTPGGNWADAEKFQERLLVPLLESPIVYFNGHVPPYFSGVEEKLLREYVEQGGFLFAEACCGRKEFDQGYRALIKRLFPDTPLKKLDPKHPIYTAHFPLPPTVELWGIELGCKTVAVYSPVDLSCRWESNKPETPEGQLAFRVGANIVAYATGKEPPKPRLSQAEVLTARGEPDKIPRGFLKVAQLRHEGDWHPAPQAMHNLMLYLRNHYRLDVALQKKEISASDPDLALYRFLYMHGRNPFSFSTKELERLRNNLQTGGLLFADACCGRPAFDTSFREFAVKLFPGKNLEPISPDDELFDREISGEKITTVLCRREPEGGFQKVLPQLEGIKLNNRWVVIYSKYDIGCALEKHKSSDCLGHDFESARKLAGAAILYALKR